MGSSCSRHCCIVDTTGPLLVDVKTAPALVNVKTGPALVDFKNLEDDPHGYHLEFANRVQSHGVLVCLDNSSFKILQCSLNIYEHFGIRASSAVGKYADLLLKPKSWKDLKAALQESEDNREPVLVTSINDRVWFCIVYQVSHCFVLEFEPVTPDPPCKPLGASKLSKYFARMAKTETLDKLFQTAVECLQELLGFDRVLCYQFHEAGFGRVVAEVMSPDADIGGTLNGQFFSAKEVPTTSKCLFLKNTCRLIVNVNSEPSPLVPAVNPATNSVLDLTQSTLRGVSSCHVNYCQNLRLHATLVHSVTLNNSKLWGFFICHHYKSHFVPVDIRNAASQLVDYFGVLIANKIEAACRADDSETLKMQTHMLNLVAAKPETDVLASCVEYFKRIMRCDGVAVINNDYIHSFGVCPPKPAVLAIVDHLDRRIDKQEVFLTECASDIFKTMTLGSVGGVLGVALSGVSRTYAVWFRNTTEFTIGWAGDKEKLLAEPEKDMTYQDGIIACKKKNSVMVWRDRITNCSDPWELANVATAKMLRVNLADVRAAHDAKLQALFLERKNHELAILNRQISRVATDLRQLLETVPVPIFSTDMEFKVEEWNPTAESLTGWRRIEMIGTSLLESVINVDNRALVRSVFMQALRGDRVAGVEVSIFRRDTNQRLEFLLHAAPRYEGEGGRIVGLVGVCEDLTQKKEAVRAHERTVLAQAANNAKTQFLCTISHEMRTPLNAVLGMLQLALSSDCTAEEMPQFVQQAFTSGQHLRTVINDVLDVGQIEAGKVTLRQVAFDFRVCAKAALDLVNNSANATKNLGMVLDVRAEVPKRIVGDEDRLRQVMVNLLSNSVKYSQKGTVRLMSDVDERGSPEQRVLIVEIMDEGIGMCETDLRVLFTRFMRVRDERLQDPGGTGLGLVICKNLVELMGGSIAVNSALNQGTTFTIRLPLIEADGGAGDSLKLPTGPSKTRTFTSLMSSSHKARILLVEDNTVNMRVAKTMLEKVGHEVEWASNGKRAIDQYRTAVEKGTKTDLNPNFKPFDIIFMDLEMPVMGGLESSRCIRALEHESGSSHTPIIGLTAHVMQEQERACYDAGMDGYITKPVMRDDLYHAIKEHVFDHADASDSFIRLKSPSIKPKFADTSAAIPTSASSTTLLVTCSRPSSFSRQSYTSLTSSRGQAA